MNVIEAKNNLFLPLKKGYVAIDIESQGYVKNCPIEIAAVKFSPNGERLCAYCTFVRPRTRSISKYVTGLTGITYNMVKGAPRPSEVIGPLVEFIGRSPIIGHAFSDNDLPILNYFSRAVLRSELRNPVVDTLYWSQALYPNLGHWGLQALAEAFDIEVDVCHRAEADCETTSRLYQEMVHAICELPPQELNEVLSRFAHRNDKKENRDEKHNHVGYGSLPVYRREDDNGRKTAVLKIWHWNGETRLKGFLNTEIPVCADRVMDYTPGCGWYAYENRLGAENVTPKAVEMLIRSLSHDGYGVYREN